MTSGSAASASGEVGGVAHGRHSMFWTCSRTCSTVAFRSRPIRVSSMSADLAHKVLASRLSSWQRKSSWRPTGPSSVQQRRRRLMVGAQPIELLARIGLGGEQRRLLGQPVGRQRRHARPAAPTPARSAGRRWPPAASRPPPAPARRAGRDAPGDRAEPPPAARPRRRGPSTRCASARSRPSSRAASSAARASPVGIGSSTSMTPRSASSPSALGGRRRAEPGFDLRAPGARTCSRTSALIRTACCAGAPGELQVDLDVAALQRRRHPLADGGLQPLAARRAAGSARRGRGR